MEAILKQLFSTEFVSASIRLTTPLLLSALGAIFTSRAGVLNLNLEGTMLASALGGVIGSYYLGTAPTGNPNVWAGLLCGMIVGVGIASILAYVGIYLKSNMVLAGTALNLMVSGGTIFILFKLTGEKGTSLKWTTGRLPIVNIPIIKDIPILGDILSGYGVLTYVAVIAVFVASFLWYKTAIGLRIRAVGENPEAAESVGINVKKIQTMALMICGGFASLGGIQLSMFYMNWFQRDMTAGRGFMALAAMNLGNATPIGTALASLMFGASEELAMMLQNLQYPAQIVLMIPYVVTILGLVAYAINRQHKIKKAQAAR